MEKKIAAADAVCTSSPESDRVVEALRSAQPDLPPIWRPTVGDVLIGDITAGGNVHTPDSSTNEYIYVRELSSGAMWTVFPSAVLHRRMREKNVTTGDTIGLHYLGKRKHYHEFTVLIAKKEQQPCP